MAENAQINGGTIALPQTQYGGQLIIGALIDSSDLKELTKGQVTWVEPPASGAAGISSDPCSRRKFCGNLTVIFNGAGENLSNDPKAKGVDSNARSTVQFLQMAARPKVKNAKILLLSSDSTPAVASAISKAKGNMGYTALTCDGVDVAEMVLPSNSDSCTCYIGYTDRDTVYVAKHFEKKGVVEDSVKAVGKGQSSLLTFANPLQNYNRWTLMSNGPKGINGPYLAPIFTIETPKANHYDLFALTSADVYADGVISTTPPPAIQEPKLKLVSATSDPGFETAYHEVVALAGRARVQNNEFVASLGRDPNALKNSRDGAKDFFNNCLHKPDPADRLCVEFRSVINLIASKKAELKDFADALGLLEQVKADLGEMAGSPVLEAKSKDPLIQLALFRQYWKNFDRFTNSLTRAAQRLGRADDVVAALEQMSTKWATYHSAFTTAYFPDIIGDTLKRRTDNYLKAAELLRAKFIETGDPKYERNLYRLRSHLKCVLNFPLGPNYRAVEDFPGK